MLFDDDDEEFSQEEIDDEMLSDFLGEDIELDNDGLELSDEDWDDLDDDLETDEDEDDIEF